jgi:hypothetical protein
MLDCALVVAVVAVAVPFILTIALWYWRSKRIRKYQLLWNAMLKEQQALIAEKNMMEIALLKRKLELLHDARKGRKNAE